MAKKKKNQKSKTSDIASNSLLPARHHGEEPDIPFVIKTEPFEDPNIEEIFSMVESSKHNTVLPEDAEISNQSNMSTATQPMDTGEGTVNDSDADLAENQVMPTSFEQILLKQEPIESKVANNDDSRVEESMSNNLVQENSASAIFPVVKKETVENEETCQEIGDQEVSDAAFNIKAEAVDNNENVSELQNSSQEILFRKADKKKIEEGLETIRKRMKTEPVENDGESSSGIDAKEIIDDDIEVLPKRPKDIEVVTISDEEEEDQNAESQNVASMNMPKKIPKKRNFSIDILKYFNVVSELDRYDCQASLDHLSKFKSSNALQKFFRTVKKEEKSKNKIQKGDILFKSILTETDSDTERPCSSENVDSNFLNKFPVPPAAESVSNCVSFPVQHAAESQYGGFPIQHAAASEYVNFPAQLVAASQNVNFPAQHAAASQSLSFPAQQAAASKYVNFPVPSTSQSTMTSPVAPVSSNFGLQNPQIAVSASNSGTGERDLPMSVPDLQKILEYIEELNPGQNLPLKDFCLPKDPKKYIDTSTSILDQHQLCENSPIYDQHQNVPLCVPRQNMSLDLHKNIQSKGIWGNSPVIDQHKNIPILDPRLNVSLDALNNALKNIPLHDPRQNISLDPHKNILSKNIRENFPVIHPRQNMSLDALKNVPLQGMYQNSSQHDQHQNLQLHDPRLRKKPRLENESIIPLITSQPAAPLPNQRFSGASASSYPVRVSSVLAASSSANKVTFPDRKGEKDLLLYHNIGRDDITLHYEILILQWNPSWMEIQKSTGSWPPICNSYPTVGYFYRNEMDYYNTYAPLHLLHVWYNMYECWEKKTFTVIEGCRVQSVAKIDNSFRIVCSIELKDTEVWPKKDDIIWCKHNGEEAFLLVKDDRKKPIDLSVSKLWISLRSLHDLNLQVDDELNFCILWNICTGRLQTEALNSLDNSMKELILKPEYYSGCIGIIQLDINKHIKEQRDAVFKILKLDDIRVTAIETYHGFNSVLMLTHLSFNIVHQAAKYELVSKNEKKQHKVLIIMKSNDLFIKLYKSLSTYGPILAVHTKQIELPPELIRHTLEDRLGNKENINDILNNHHIFMTTFSAFGSAEKRELSKLKNLICIIDDAHLCTEVETALPLTLKIKKLLLIGDRQKPFPMPDILKSQNYHISLFVRLLKARRHL